MGQVKAISGAQFDLGCHTGRMILMNVSCSAIIQSKQQWLLWGESTTFWILYSTEKIATAFLSLIFSMYFEIGTYPFSDNYLHSFNLIPALFRVSRFDSKVLDCKHYKVNKDQLNTTGLSILNNPCWNDYDLSQHELLFFWKVKNKQMSIELSADQFRIFFFWFIFEAQLKVFSKAKRTLEN